MLGRDRGRFADCRRRLNECPLGAAALAGTAFPIDRDATAAALGFDRPAANSLDAVSDRDFAIEFLAAAALAGTHLSRFAEEIVIWCERPVRLHPAQRCVHHRQLDHAAKAQPRRRRAGARQDRPAQRLAGRAADGDEGAAARLSKGHAGGQGSGVRGVRRARTVPRGDDRHGARHAGPIASGCAPSPARGFSTATDLADWLVRALGCRSAGPITSPARSSSAPRPGAARSPNCRSPNCRRSSRAITAAVFDVLDVDRSVASRTSFGGTAPVRVREAAAAARRRFLA